MKLNEKSTVMISGIPQRIHLWAKDETKPVILFLHGGPGMPFRHKIKKYLLPLTDDFVLAAIDERGAGGSYSPALKPEDLSIDAFLSDIKEWTDYLCRRFHHKKIYIVGHSFGSYLASRAVLENPELYAAYLGVGQVVDMADLMEERYRMLCQKAREIGDVVLSEKLEGIGKPTGGKFLTKEGGEFFSSHYYAVMEPAGYPSFEKREIKPVMRSFEYTREEKANWSKGIALSRAATSPVIASLTLKPYGYVYKIPHYIIQGMDDISAPYSLAKEYAEKIRAPKHAFLTYTRSGHEPCFEEPERFMIDVRNRFREDVD